MRSLRRHEGTWTGRYQHVDLAGTLVDSHDSRVECVFPQGGKYAYVQRNTFDWDDGRQERFEFFGELQGDRLYWDNERFKGYAWKTEHDVILLRLNRKDEPATMFLETIILEDGKDTRVRTWHWFTDGVPVRRTLCNEARTQ